MCDRFLKQRIKIKFCAKLGKNESDTCAVLSKAHGGEAVKMADVFGWHKRFKGRLENVEDDESNGGPRFHRTDENAEKVRNLVHSHRRLSIRSVAGKGKLKLSLCLTKQHAMKTYWGSGGIAPRILDLSTRWR
jgi:hypothetical protein